MLFKHHVLQHDHARGQRLPLLHRFRIRSLLPIIDRRLDLSLKSANFAASLSLAFLIVVDIALTITVSLDRCQIALTFVSIRIIINGQ